jgi:hypothetical protein
MGGLVAADFIPGFTARVVSVGKDGKCRLVDFDGGTTILRTWHVNGLVTCLSVLPLPRLSLIPKRTQTDAPFPDVDSVFKVLIAIGTEDGRVLIFNVIGLLEQEVKIGAGVLGLQWVERKSGS